MSGTSDKKHDKETSETLEDKAPKGEMPVEIGGQKGPEPTRYGDWEKGGIISDF